MADKKLTIPVLTDTNWAHWRKNVVVALKSRELWAIVSDTEHVAAGADATVRGQFVAKQMKAIQLIISSISEDLTHLIPMEPEDPVQIWKDLVAHFESKSAFNVLTLNQQLTIGLKERDDPNSWLADRKSTYLRLSAIGQPISETLQCMSTLALLPPSYKSLTTSLTTQIAAGELDMAKIQEFVKNYKRSSSSRPEEAAFTGASSSYSTGQSVSGQFQGKRGKSSRGKTRGGPSRGGRGGQSRGSSFRGGGAPGRTSSEKECYECGGFGHIRPECPNFLKKQPGYHSSHLMEHSTLDAVESHHTYHASHSVNGSGHRNRIIFDSGASSHMSFAINCMKNITYFDNPDVVTLGDGHVTNCIGIGDLYAIAHVSSHDRVFDECVVFKNCLIVPSMRCHLFSVRTVTNVDDRTVEFGKDFANVWYKGESILQGRVDNGVYVVNAMVVDPHAPGFDSLAPTVGFVATKTISTGEPNLFLTDDSTPLSVSEGEHDWSNRRHTVGHCKSLNPASLVGVAINREHDKAPVIGERSIICDKNAGTTVSVPAADFDDSGSMVHGHCANAVTAQVWHRRFGHLGADNLQKLINGNYVSGMILSNKTLPFCQPCTEGKAHVLPYPQVSNTRSNGILDMIHSDVFGPVTNLSYGHSKYFVTFIDDYSRFVWVRFIQNKSEVYDKFIELITMLENVTGQKLKVFRSDRGGEFMSKSFENFLKSRGILHQLATADAHAQNGVAERMNRTLLEQSRAMLCDSGVPKSFWGEAVATAVYVRNRSPSTSIPSNTTPYELWSGRQPIVRHLRVFGCDAFAHIPLKQRKKLDSKTEKCIFLGYSTHSKAYRLYSLQRQSIIVRRDVTFNEDSFVREGDIGLKTPVVRTITVDLGAQPEPVPQPVIPPVIYDEASEDEDEDFDDAHEDIVEPVVVEPPPPVVEPRRSGRETHKPDRLGYSENAFSADIQIPEPRSWKEAMKSSDAASWKKAAEAEYQSLVKHHTWDMVPLPEGKKLVGGRWVFRAKHDEYGRIERFKGRYVAQGFSQVFGEDYNEIFAPVVRWESVRTLISMAVQYGMQLHQMDVETAFLNGLLSEEIYMKPPEGFVKPGQEHLVCKLKHSIYGLKQSPRCWNEVLHKHLIDMQFIQSISDPCIYVGKINGQLVFVAVYVDDLIIAAKQSSVIDKTKKLFAQKFSVKDMGQLHYFLGVRIIQTTNSVWLSQEKYCNNILERYGMSNCAPVATPMETSAKPLKAHDSSKICDQRLYQSVIGSLLYLAGATRPDLSQSVHKLAQYSSCPTTEHWSLVKRILRYVKGTVDVGLLFKCHSNSSLAVYADSDYAGDLSDRKSTSGYVLLKNGAAISWKSKKQSVVAQSTAEAEYVALFFAVQETIWIRRMLHDLHEELSGPTVVYEDNQAAIKIVQNPVDHPKTKHIATKFHFTRQHVEDGVVKLTYCPTEKMLADIFTKPLARDRFEMLRYGLGLTLEPQEAEKEC